MLHNEVYHEVHMDLQIAGLCEECGENPAVEAMPTCQSCLDEWADANCPEDEILDDFPTELDNFGIAEGEGEVSYIEAAQHKAIMGKAERAYINQQWHAWRTDYRCERPEAVDCQTCGTRYEPNEEGNLVFQGVRLIQCSQCQ